MKSAVNPIVWREDAAASPAALQFSSDRSELSIAPREVVRCQECDLVQFRTTSDLCRRCAKPLPSQFPQLAQADAAPLAQGPAEYGGDAEEFFEEEGIARGERNRRLAIGSRVQAWRKKRGLRQGQLAKQLGIPRTYLSRIENNRLLPGPLMMPKIATVLRVNIADLLPGSPAQQQSASLATDDPLANSILRTFLLLPPQQRDEVLARTRRWVAGNVSLRPAMELPRRQPGRAMRPEALMG